jgi:putative addiction module component (TIGR02574 family)
MSAKAKKIIEEIRALPREERELIADEAWRSLDEGDVEAAWSEEIKKRLDEIDSGTVKMIPFDEAMAQIEESLREKREHSSRSVKRT